MTNGRDFHSATLLPSGDVVIAGGNSFFSISSVELYNQTSGTFTGAGSLSTPRHFHTATLLPSGKVLFVGGVNEFSGQESPEFSVLWSAGLFDPNSTVLSSPEAWVLSASGTPPLFLTTDTVWAETLLIAEG